MKPLFILLVSAALAQQPSLVREVRAAAASGDFASAQKTLDSAKLTSGISPRWLEAHSWMGRGYLGAKDYDAADRYAAETRKLALEVLRSRKLDAEPALPIALGASIEVQAQVLNARGQKAEAVAFLQQELKSWHDTSIRTRIQKNLNLISLVGHPAPALDTRQFLGAQHPPTTPLKGRKVLLFFWAHWCGDCKATAAAIARIAREYPSLTVIGPTQTYGYAARGEEVPRDAEVRYIDQIRQQYYGDIRGLTVPVSEENFKTWGASTTPTLALIDEAGIVRLYHPGRMSYEELLPYVRD